MITGWSPCIFEHNGRVCGIHKAFHTSGHRGELGVRGWASAVVHQFDLKELKQKFIGFLDRFLDMVSYKNVNYFGSEYCF